MKIKETFVAPLLVLTSSLLLLFSRALDVSALSESDNAYLALVVLQLIVFVLPALIYCKLKGKGYIKKLRLAPPKADAMVSVFVSAALLISGELLLRIILGNFFELQGGFSLYGTYTASGTGSADNALYLIFAFALIPAICEEFVFRSILCAEYESCGVFTAVLSSSLLFCAIHFNVERAPIYLFSGIVLAMTLYMTRSAIATVIAHFIYNMFGLFGQKYMSAFYETTGSEELFVFLVALIFLLLLAAFFGEAGRLYASYSQKNKDSSYVLPKKAKRGKMAEALFSPTYLVCILLFVIVSIGLD